MPVEFLLVILWGAAAHGDGNSGTYIAFGQLIIANLPWAARSLAERMDKGEGL